MKKMKSGKHATVWGEFILTIILVVFLFPGSQFLYANPDSSPPQVVAGVSNTTDNIHPAVGTSGLEPEKPDQSEKPNQTDIPNKSKPLEPSGKPAQTEEPKTTDSVGQPDIIQPDENSQQKPGQEPGGTTVDLPDQITPSESAVFRGNPQSGKKVALTFDDGPYAVLTAEYLKVLEEYQVPAAFFLVGTRVEKYPEIARKIKEHGFELGSHSYRHAKLTLVKQEILEEDFRKTEAALALAGEVKFFRPPYGAHNQLVTEKVEKYGLKTIGWNVDPRDWDTEDSQIISQRVLSHVTNGSIILLHEGRKSTLAALPKIISRLQDKGYEIVTVAELLK